VSTPRELLAVAVAVLVHGAFFGVARTLPEMNLLFERSSNEEPGLLWVDTDESTPVAVAEERDESKRDPETKPEDSERDEPAANDQKLAGATREDRALPAATAPEVDGEKAPPGGENKAGLETGPALPPNDGFSPLEAGPSGGIGSLIPGGTLGLAGRIAIAGSEGEAAPTTAPAAKQADGATVNKLLSSTLLGQTRAKGIDLPATQVVVGAVSSQTRTLSVPHNTRASFTVKLGPGGKVQGVKVSSASAGDASAWEGAAKAVAAQLSGKQLGLGDAASSGATVVVSVTVRHVFPTGSAKGADVKPVCANQMINDILDATDKKPAAAGEATIPLFTDENGRPCIPVGVGGTADAANIGATKQIQVTTSTKVLVDGKEALPLDILPVNKDIVDTGKGGPKPVLPQKLRKQKRDREKKK
jgi:hypothetical protein